MCNYNGCIYNDDGQCCYDRAAIRIESAKACSEHDSYMDDTE